MIQRLVSRDHFEDPGFHNARQLKCDHAGPVWTSFCGTGCTLLVLLVLYTNEANLVAVHRVINRASRDMEDAPCVGDVPRQGLVHLTGCAMAVGRPLHIEGFEESLPPGGVRAAWLRLRLQFMKAGSWEDIEHFNGLHVQQVVSENAWIGDYRADRDVALSVPGRVLPLRMAPWQLRGEQLPSEEEQLNSMTMWQEGGWMLRRGEVRVFFEFGAPPTVSVLADAWPCFSACAKGSARAELRPWVPGSRWIMDGHVKRNMSLAAEGSESLDEMLALYVARADRDGSSTREFWVLLCGFGLWCAVWPVTACTCLVASSFDRLCSTCWRAWLLGIVLASVTVLGAWMAENYGYLHATALLALVIWIISSQDVLQCCQGGAANLPEGPLGAAIYAPVDAEPGGPPTATEPAEEPQPEAAEGGRRPASQRLRGLLGDGRLWFGARGEYQPVAGDAPDLPAPAEPAPPEPPPDARATEPAARPLWGSCSALPQVQAATHRFVHRSSLVVEPVVEQIRADWHLALAVACSAGFAVALLGSLYSAMGSGRSFRIA